MEKKYNSMWGVWCANTVDGPCGVGQESFFYFYFLRNSALLKQNNVQKVKNPRGYTGNVLKSLQGSKI